MDRVYLYDSKVGNFFSGMSILGPFSHYYHKNVDIKETPFNRYNIRELDK